ncbi:MAG: uncharacterized SAM-binding protein YcdF (DUF218 family) [Desulforhopalus sp.]|jgi:uncharacterized SAM-binding protein YcdF (DUF218 family)
MNFKPLFKCSAIFIGFICLVAVVQTATAIYFSKAETKLEPADLIVVFPGDSARTTAGLKLVKEGYGSNFMIISITSSELAKRLTKHAILTQTNLLPGGKSRSTFEDVFQTLETIKAHDFKSIIVVTSSYHLPRALLLLKGYLLSSSMDISVQGLPITSVQIDQRKGRNYSNEIVKFWGSFTEMVTNRVTGILLLDYPIARMIQKHIKRTLIR